MPRIFSIVLALLTLVEGAGAAAPPLGLATYGRVMRVIDGDTLDVEMRYTIRVRLLNAWCPELKEPGGEKAKSDLEEWSLGKPCVLYVPTERVKTMADLFTFGRVLGEVWLVGEERSLSELQVAHGNATPTKER